MKNIIICADGTWNSPLQEQATNVLRIARAIADRDGQGHNQVVFYDWGVGSYYGKVSGGVAGEGLEKNITDCYRFIVHNYEPGDRLYFFGFSRGAFTVRSLGGFIRNCGILKKEHAGQIEQGFKKVYKKRSKNTHPDSDKAKTFRSQFAVADRSDIHFVGVFDTVGALGVPITFWGLLDNDEHLFHDLEPSSIIRTARHALSLDECRKDYEAAIWTDKPDIDLLQVWFPGVHSDIGGGYADDHRLADQAMLWMLKEAQAAGLKFKPALRRGLDPDPMGKEHNEYKHIYRLRGRRYRRPGPGALFHRSVKQRIEQGDRSKALEYHLEREGLELGDCRFVR